MEYNEKMMKKYRPCPEARKTCGMGGWCESCMYAYPGNGIVSHKPEDYTDVCEMSPIEEV